MKFELLPVIDIMLDLYQQPLNADRFEAYLKLLHGNSKADMVLPIAGFNPMAKEHLIDILNELKKLDVENIMHNTLEEINQQIHHIKNDTVFKVALNVSDDLKGGWTNRYTSDYDSKFRFSGIFNRNFCTPVIWSGEDYSSELIQQRTIEYVYRTIYWINHAKPKTLKEHVLQEQFVARQSASHPFNNTIDLSYAKQFFLQYENDDSYAVIVNFLYGDEASASLQFSCYGNKGWMHGFEFAKRTI